MILIQQNILKVSPNIATKLVGSRSLLVSSAAWLVYYYLLTFSDEVYDDSLSLSCRLVTFSLTGRFVLGTTCFQLLSLQVDSYLGLESQMVYSATIVLLGNVVFMFYTPPSALTLARSVTSPWDGYHS